MLFLYSLLRCRDSGHKEERKVILKWKGAGGGGHKEKVREEYYSDVPIKGKILKGSK